MYAGPERRDTKSRCRGVLTVFAASHLEIFTGAAIEVILKLSI
jgi:hypothetical protein